MGRKGRGKPKRQPSNHYPRANQRSSGVSSLHLPNHLGHEQQIAMSMLAQQEAEHRRILMTRANIATHLMAGMIDAMDNTTDLQSKVSKAYKAADMVLEKVGIKFQDGPPPEQVQEATEADGQAQEQEGSKIIV